MNQPPSSLPIAELLKKIGDRTAHVCVVGLGYVGLPLAVEQAAAGYSVVGIDLNPNRVSQINDGHSYVEDVNELRLKEAVKSGKLRASTDFQHVAEANVITICVPTPLGVHKDPDTSYIESVLEAIAPWVRKGQLIILESTTYPGTTEELVVPKLQALGLRVGHDLFVAFSPERIDPGNPSFKLRDIPKIVGGVTPACSDAAAAMYASVLGSKVRVVSSPRTAEMTKLLENIFRIVNVSLVNELAMLCDQMNVDVWEVIEAAKTKPFGYMPFYPGPGMGGHCIPVDAFYLSWKAKEYNFSTKFIELAGQINDAMPDYVVDRIGETLNESSRSIRGARILLLGLAYKGNVADLRESPAIEVAERLIDRGAMIRYHDPHIPGAQLAGRPFESVPLTGDEVASHDLVVILTNHSNVDYRLVETHAKLVYDTRNAISSAGGSVRRLGAGGQEGRRRRHG